MTLNRKYWPVMLSLIISISLLFPFCCHAAMGGHVAHQQKTFSQAQHRQAPQHNLSECGCGHELSKDFQTPKDIRSSAKILMSSAALFVDRYELLHSDVFITLTASQTPPSGDPGPPLYLLHRVFLN